LVLLWSFSVHRLWQVFAGIVKLQLRELGYAGVFLVVKDIFPRLLSGIPLGDLDTHQPLFCKRNAYPSDGSDESCHCRFGRENLFRIDNEKVTVNFQENAEILLHVNDKILGKSCKCSGFLRSLTLRSDPSETLDRHDTAATASTDTSSTTSPQSMSTRLTTPPC
jgi:hypothetical protein